MNKFGPLLQDYSVAHLANWAPHPTPDDYYIYSCAAWPWPQLHLVCSCSGCRRQWQRNRALPPASPHALQQLHTTHHHTITYPSHTHSTPHYITSTNLESQTFWGGGKKCPPNSIGMSIIIISVWHTHKSEFPPFLVAVLQLSIVVLQSVPAYNGLVFRSMSGNLIPNSSWHGSITHWLIAKRCVHAAPEQMIY